MNGYNDNNILGMNRYGAVKRKYRSKRLIKIWAMIMGVEVLLLGAFTYLVFKIVTTMNVWC